MDWARTIKTYRASRGIIQAELAYDLGVDVTTISRWERGIVEPDLGRQRILQDLLFNKQTFNDRYAQAIRSTPTLRALTIGDEFRLGAISGVTLRLFPGLDDMIGETMDSRIMDRVKDYMSIPEVLKDIHKREIVMVETVFSDIIECPPFDGPKKRTIVTFPLVENGCLHMDLVTTYADSEPEDFVKITYADDLVDH